MVNLIKSNKNNTLKSISNILDTVVDKNDYKLELKNGLFLLTLQQSILLKVAKVLKENEKLKFISASFDKKIIEFKEFETLAKLPSLEELRAKIVGYITAPHQKLISILNAPATETAGVIENYSKKK